MSSIVKIAYFGSDAICLPGLRYLVDEASDVCELAMIISQPDRRSGRGKRMQQNPVAAFAVEKGIPLLQPDKPDDGLRRKLDEAGLALAFVMAYGHFLPKSIREAPEFGMLNFHGSLLPAYRGASPVETAIAMGEKETGVCLMEVVREMDAGRVADCEKVCINDTDTAVTLRARVGDAVVPLLGRNLDAAVSGRLCLEEQDLSKASFCRKIRKEDAALDFHKTALELDRRLRAFSPWPGGYFDHGETRIKVGRSVPLVQECRESPGTVLASGETLDIATSDGVLSILELQRPGGRMLETGEFLKGYSISPGTVLPSVEGGDLLRAFAG